MTTYSTPFKLTEPVNDFNTAQEYLSEDDMVQYLHGDSRYDKVKNVTSVNWKLLTDDSGVIEVESTEPLDQEALDQVSNWISGQNSDGLGEGFEQQPFAEHDNREDYDYIDSYSRDAKEDYYDDDIDYEPEYSMSSFDWQDNDYKLTIKEPIVDETQSYLNNLSSKKNSSNNGYKDPCGVKHRTRSSQLSCRYCKTGKRNPQAK